MRSQNRHKPHGFNHSHCRFTNTAHPTNKQRHPNVFQFKIAFS